MSRPGGASGGGVLRGPGVGRWVALAVLLVLLVLAPRWLSAFWLQAGLFSMAAAVAAIGLTLLVGTAGQLSLGHAFFVAVGAYGYAFFAGEPATIGVGGAGGLGWPPLLALVAAVVVAGIAGAAFSPISGRLYGIYLGIATLGLVFVGQHLLKNVEPFAVVSGGFNGRNVPELTMGGWGLDSLARLWYAGVVMLVGAFVFARNLRRGRPGRALEAVRDSEIVAGVMGVRVAATKAAAFTVSSMYAGLGGVLLALTFRRIVPESFGFLYSIDLLAMIVIGGLGSVGGAVLGASLVTLLPLVFSRYAETIPLVDPVGGAGFDAATAARVLYGAVVVLALMFLPDGLAGIGRMVRTRAQRRSEGRRDDAPVPASDVRVS